MRHRHHNLGRARGAVACAAVVAVLAAGCASPARPDATVRCQPKSIEIDLTNVSEHTARYTVGVEIDRAGLKETERYSSNDVGPGATVTLTDDRPDDEETCKVVSVEVFTP